MDVAQHPLVVLGRRRHVRLHQVHQREAREVADRRRDARRRARVDDRAAVLERRGRPTCSPSPCGRRGGRSARRRRRSTMSAWPCSSTQLLVGVDRVEAADRLAVRLGMRAEDAVDHAAVRVEEDVHRAVEAAHRRDLVDVRAHRAGVGAVVRLRRGDERAVVRLDRLVRDDAREDQLAAAPRAPVVRLRLADRDLQLRRRHLVQQPDGRAARRDADERVGVRVLRVVLAERPAVPLHPGEVLAADLLLHVRLGHREDLPVRAADADVGDPGGLDRVEHGREELRRGSRPELVVDDHGDAPLAREELRERRPVDRLGERPARRLGRVADGRRLVRLDDRDQVRGRDLDLERVAMLLRLVVGRPDRERVHRLVRDDDTGGLAHGILRRARAWSVPGERSSSGGRRASG